MSSLPWLAPSAAAPELRIAVSSLVAALAIFVAAWLFNWLVRRTLTGFVAVGAVAFFAAWSVLSNIFCTLLILTTRPFRLNDRIELLENGEKPGLKGRVIDINFVYTTLHETAEDGSDTVLQIPNSQFFQKITRRWRG